ncbi:hypothetical protein ACOBR2_06190 [Telmatobacter bradus]|uniref:hypothetical protein n=1 Tax=Telmatobacter bradus TaxID=474953 RepID=UPI003B430259
MKIARSSIVLLLVQLALVSSIAAKYLYERHHCPRVWTRVRAIDSTLPMRGRYLSLNLIVDGCRSTLPSAKLAASEHDTHAAVLPHSHYVVRGPHSISFPVHLKVENNTLLALWPEGEPRMPADLSATANTDTPCSELVLDQPVDYFIGDVAQSPLPLKSGQELWIEVTVPPAGPPRPLQLALKENNIWKPLELK